jgi:hypothetical protein
MVKIPLTFQIRPSHYRAIFDTTRLKVLCAAKCAQIADVSDPGQTGKQRWLVKRSGWVWRPDGVLILPERQVDRLQHGHIERHRRPFRYWSRDATKGINAPAELQAIMDRVFLGDFPAVAQCPICKQYNVLEFDRLDVWTDEKKARALGVVSQ